MSSTFLSASNAEASSVRPRNRRLISVEGESPPLEASSSIRGTARLASRSPTPRRGASASPVPSSRLNVSPPEAASRSSSRRGKSPAAGGLKVGLLEGSWTDSWNSVQDLAAGWLSGGAGPSPTPRRQQSRATSRNGSRQRPWAQEQRAADSRPTIKDVGAGIMAEREAALREARMASILESHDGVNGGLDVAGKFKARTSDDMSGDAAADEPEEVHAYIHHVQSADTYAGIVLKYGCRDDEFKRANGLWSQNSIMMRKWVALPVDACEVKGRACDAPIDTAQDPERPSTPEEIDDYSSQSTESPSQQNADDIFGPSPANGAAAPEEEMKPEDPERPWKHVRWVSIDSFKEPVEIGRISKKSFGYFRPRRKRSLLSTVSPPQSTTRPSLDAQSTTQVSREGGDDRGGPSSRRHSQLSNRPSLAIGSGGMSTPASTRSRMGSAGADSRPSWMRQPGGVGSMNRNVRAPGPEKDPLNSWAKKHFPALIVDSLPSMAITGGETAQLGISAEGGPIAGAPAGEAMDLSKQTGTGLDRAAATVENWLRGALAKRPGTPTGGPEGGDMIELTESPRQSEDGRLGGRAADLGASLGTLLATATGGNKGGKWDASVSRRGKDKGD